MVIFSKCQRTSRNHGIFSDIPMNGEEIGLGSSTPALAGYLGKVQERSASLENCPWCAAKGMTSVLRSYRVNFQESIALCTSPQCLFPLVSRPLEDVLASLVAPEPQTGAKRRTPWAQEQEDPVPPKRLRSEEESDEEASQPIGDRVSQPEPTVMGDHDRGPLPQNGKANGHRKDSDWLAPEEMDQEVVQGGKETGAIPEEIAPSLERVCLDKRLLPPWKPAQDPLDQVPIIILSSDSEVELMCTQTDASGSPKTVTSSIATAVSTLNDESDSEVELINSSGPSMAVTSGATPATALTSEERSQTNASGPPEPVTTPAVSTAQNSESPPAEVNFTSEAVVRSESERLADGLSEARAEGRATPVCRPCSVDLSQSRLDQLETLTDPAKGPTRDHAVKTRRRSSEDAKGSVEDLTLEDAELRDAGGLEGNKRTEMAPSVDRLIGSQELCQVSPYLFWKNEQTFSWLDSLLVAIANCRALKENRPETKSRRSVVWELCTIYDKCSSLIAQFGQDGIIKVPASVFLMVTEEMEALRVFVYNTLQPKLLQGKEDSLVLALPLLIKMDSWAELNFLPVFDWECVRCKRKHRIKKPLTTLKLVHSDWNPLKSTITGRCSTCNRNRKGQEKKLVMESVPPVVALHFENGLPHAHVAKYSFDHKQHHYLVTTVVQYSKERKHFTTWIRKPNGLWLEFDDLKHPDCVSHQDLSIPAQEIHIVFWERGEKTEKFHRRSLVDPLVPDPVVPIPNRSLEAKDFLANEPVESHDLSIGVPHDDTGIVAALTPSDAEHDMDREVDASVGSTTLLDAFEGLSHNDIITLTLTEVKGDSTREPPEGDVLPSPPAPEVRRSSLETSPKPASPATPSQPSELILPTVVSSACEAKTPSGETEQVSPVSSTPALMPSSAQPLCQRQLELNPPSIKAHLSPSLAKPSTLPSNTSTPVSQTKPLQSRSSGQRPRPPRPSLKVMENEALPLKSAEMYGGFCSRPINNPYQTLFPTKGPTPNATSKVPIHPVSPALPKPPAKPAALSVTSLPARGVTEHPKISKKPGGHQTKVTADLHDTDSLRLKLLKKLKAKKKKLEKLNQVLGLQGVLGVESTSKPDSTVLESYAVSSSTSVYNSPTYDEFFADLLSPATTTSNLSPDSTGFVESVTNGQDGGGDTANGGGAYQMAAAPQLGGSVAQPFGDVPMATANDNFLEELISGTSLVQTEMETDALSALELFF